MTDPGAGATTLAGRLDEESRAAFERAGSARTKAAREGAFIEGVVKSNEARLAEAYTFLQKVVGLIAVLLPPVLILGNMGFEGWEVLGSVSSYYYSNLGSVFVGALCALGMFFLSYNHKPLRGFETDKKLTNLAAVAVVLVAVFPTLDSSVDPTNGERVVSTIHLVSAGITFVLLGWLSRFQFTRTARDDDPSAPPPTEEKLKRNKLYRLLGHVIFGAIALVGINAIPWCSTPDSWHAFTVLEVVCIEAFGWSWLVKAGFLGILADKPKPT